MQTVFISFTHAIKDAIAIIPFLLLIFFAIEIIEHFYSDKIFSFISGSKFKGAAVFTGSAFGALLAAIPQCGLSVIASTLYCKRIITKGMLIAVYVATSDEALPVLISAPEGYKSILPLLSIKIIAGFVFGCLIDIFFPSSAPLFEAPSDIHLEKGCHSHNISASKKETPREYLNELVLHPVIHTLSVTFFVFLITFFINLIFAYFASNPLSLVNIAILQNKFIQPVAAAFFGIIPNCAVSVGLTVMYLKGVITFASCVSGLCAGAGLGILVLIKKNKDKKDTVLIMVLLLAASIITGFITTLFTK